jgi:aryl-phospho-beta-D-glucosidase BglC (GH1 family)
LKVIAWARKYGLRINLDLHTIPGSQNGAHSCLIFDPPKFNVRDIGFNHSGKLGQVNFLNGVMGIANAQRTLGYIRIITEFISQSEYKDVVPLFSIVNEALLSAIGRDAITSLCVFLH